MHSFSQTRTYFHLAKSTFSQQLHLTFHPNRFILSQTQVFSNSTVTQRAPEPPHPRHKSSSIPLSPKEPQNHLIPGTSLLRFHCHPKSPRTTSSKTQVFSDSTVTQTAPEQPHPRHNIHQAGGDIQSSIPISTDPDLLLTLLLEGMRMRSRGLSCLEYPPAPA